MVKFPLTADSFFSQEHPEHSVCVWVAKCKFFVYYYKNKMFIKIFNPKEAVGWNPDIFEVDSGRIHLRVV